MFVCKGSASSLRGNDRQGIDHSLGISPLFANLGLNILSKAAPPAIKDKRSGVEFPGEFCLRGSNCGVNVTGSGVRTKKIAGIKSLDIYALALYVDEGAAKRALKSKFSNSTIDALAKKQQLFDELIKSDNVEKSLVLVMTSRLVKNRNFLDALDERLAPPLTKVGETVALETFKTQFDSVKFRSGLKISFTVKGSKLVTKADGKEIGTINNKSLSRTIMEIYLGKDPVSKDAKTNFATGLASMILAA